MWMSDLLRTGLPRVRFPLHTMHSLVEEHESESTGLFMKRSFSPQQKSVTFASPEGYGSVQDQTHLEGGVTCACLLNDLPCTVRAHGPVQRFPLLPPRPNQHDHQKLRLLPRLCALASSSTQCALSCSMAWLARITVSSVAS